MIRDSTKYQTAAGWGWGRWIGTDLKPDGHTADFASTHCVDCHHAVRRNDYVFTMPINVQHEVRSDYSSRARSDPFDSLDWMLAAECLYTNSTQSRRRVSGELPYNPLTWQVISSILNPADHTLATISGNEQAVGYARHHASSKYPAGSVLAVVTWSQQDDPRWFGGKIPGSVRSVEFLEVQAAADSGQTYLYSMYSGTPLRKSVSIAEKAPTSRAAYLLAQKAAVMP